MNPWKTLNIEPTDDKIIIKKAYAVLIKQYKPDENPEKFKEIQSAYKSALAASQWQVEDRFDEQVQLTDADSQIHQDDLSDFEAEGFNLSNAPVDQEQIKFDRQQQNLIDNLYKQLKEMPFASLAVKDTLTNWKFIEGYNQIDDLVLKDEVARTVFKNVAEYNIFQMKRNKTLLINEKCLKYMDEVFDWSSNWNQYEKHFSPQYFNYTIHYKSDESQFQNGLNKIGYVIHRGFAFFIDLFLIGMLSIFLPDFEIGFFINILSFTFLFVMIRFSFEMISKSRFTLGKYFTKLMVVDEYGNTCSRSRLVIRHTIFNILFIPMLLFDKSNNDLLGYYLIVFILVNLITSLFNIEMLHDYLSKTKVVYKN